MSLEKMQYEELIQYCKDNNLDYLTKAKKSKAHATLLKELSNLSITDKTDKTDETIKTDIQTNKENNIIELINETVWKLEDNNVKDNDEYIKNKQIISSLIKKCHNLLYSNAISGKKAQSDIMKILSIVALNSLIKDKKNNINVDKLIEEHKIIITGDKLIKYKSYIVDNINLILSEQNIFNEWKKFITHFVSKLFPMIINENDTIFNISNEYIFRDLIKYLSTINDNPSLSKDLPIICGDIYEYFLEYSGSGSGAKELGQYFTPRGLINAILYGCGFNEMISKIENPTIYDPCMGTGGMLSRTFISTNNIISSNIYGSDYENDTFKIGQSTLSILTKLGNINITNCNSLLDTDKSYLFKDIEFDVIITNPPFGVNIKYKEVFKDNIIDYKEIYPIVTNNGTSLFIQMIMYKLKIGGICAIVLPDGELMSSNNTSNINMRKFILDNAKIIKIINVEGGIFQNTNIKTKVLIFQKGKYDNYNQEIEFLDVINGGKEIKLITKQKLNKTYQFNIKKQEEKINYNNDFELIEFREIFDLIKGKIQSSKVEVDDNGEGVMVTQSKNKLDYKKIKNWHIDGNNLFIGNIDSGKKICINFYEGKCDYTNLLLLCKIKENYNNKINIKYIYYYLISIKDKLTKEYLKGAANLSLDVENFNLMKIPIPSLEQQKEIVEYLDLIYEKNIKLSNDKIEDIKKLNENYLKLNLKYNKKIEIKTLGEICEFQNGKRIVKGQVETGIYPVLGGGGFTSFYTNEYTREGKTCKISREGMSLHNCVMILNEKYYLNSQAFTIKSNSEKLINEYLWYYLDNIKEQIFNCGRGSAQKAIDIDEFKNIKISIPSLEQQKEIVDYLDFNNNLIDNFNKEIENNKKQGELFFNMFLSD
jgi:type I restriction-modification system DNA methylase subunit